MKSKGFAAWGNEEPSAMRAFFIINPRAGNGRAAKEWPRWAAHPDVGAWAWTDAPGHAGILVATAARQGYDAVVACGGDGTVNEVLNALMGLPSGERPALALLPGGTGDDFARCCGAALAWPDALAAIAAGNMASIDLGWATGTFGSRFFGVAAFIGAGAQMAAGANAGGKPFAGIAGYLPYLFQASRFRANVRIQSSDIEWRGRAISVEIANAATGGGGIRVCPPASMSDGMFNVVAIEAGGLARVARLLMRLPGGRHMSLSFVHHWTCSSVGLEGDGVALALDGEIVGELPAQFEMASKAIEVVVPAG